MTIRQHGNQQLFNEGYLPDNYFCTFATAAMVSDRVQAPAYSPSCCSRSPTNSFDAEVSSTYPDGNRSKASHRAALWLLCRATLRRAITVQQEKQDKCKTNHFHRLRRRSLSSVPKVDGEVYGWTLFLCRGGATWADRFRQQRLQAGPCDACRTTSQGNGSPVSRNGFLFDCCFRSRCCTGLGHGFI
jgi:hypothetical protein